MTKNNLPRCLAWLLQNHDPVPTLEHIVPVSITVCHEIAYDDADDEDDSTSPDMARLHLPPQSAKKSRLLARTKGTEALSTPAGTRSPPEHIHPVEIGRKTPQSLRHVPPIVPKTPASIYEDSVFDIDDIDELPDGLLHDLTTSSYGEFGTPEPLWTEACATRLEPIAEKKGKKRKSEDYLGDSVSPNMSKRIVNPNCSSIFYTVAS